MDSELKEVNHYWCGNVDCRTELNIQEGFDESEQFWQCKECGQINSLSEVAIDETKEESLIIKIWTKTKVALEKHPVLKWLLPCVVIGVGVGIVVVAASLSSETEDEMIYDENEFDDDYAIDNLNDSCDSYFEPRYKVDIKARKTGEWYKKTMTNYYNAAVSVAKCHSFGRAVKITDTQTGEVKYEDGGDEEIERKRENV